MLCPSDLRYLGAYARLGVPCTVEYADSAMRGRVQVRVSIALLLARHGLGSFLARPIHNEYLLDR